MTMRQEDRNRRLRIRLAITVIGVVLLVVLAILIPIWVDKLGMWKLDRSVTGFLAPPASSAPDPGVKPYLRGKVIVIDVVAAHLDPVHAELPTSIRATSRREVGTIVWLERKSPDKNFTSPRQSSPPPEWKLTLIDRQLNRVVGIAGFTGVWEDSRSEYGPPVFQPGPTLVERPVEPIEAIKRYLLALPRQ
jgi:hypothetical protein